VQAGEKAHARYVTQITLLHRMLVRAMKAKQTTEAEHTRQLRRLLDDFRKAYEQPAAAAAGGPQGADAAPHRH
jgi:hypothetical protein